MDINECIEYIKRGDGCVEEEAINTIANYLNMSNYDRFRFCYFYAGTYNIESALDIYFNNNINKKTLRYRTDRRWLRIGDRADKYFNGVSMHKFDTLYNCKSTQQAFDLVCKWYYFGRYAAFLFLECFINCTNPKWVDNLIYKWENKENYTKGAIIIRKKSIGLNNNNDVLNILKDVTNLNSFGIETVLCAVEKIEKGTRYDGFYKDRFLKEIANSKYDFLKRLFL